MNRQPDETSVDPALDALLHRALGTGGLRGAARSRQLLRLGLPLPRAAQPVAPELLLPSGTAHSQTYVVGEQRRAARSWLELAAIVLVCVCVAGLLALLYWGDGDDEPQVGAVPTTTPVPATPEPSPSASASQPATVTTTPTTSSARPTMTVQQPSAACDATAWSEAAPDGADLPGEAWLVGDGLTLARTSTRLVEGANDVWWISDEAVPTALGATQVALLGYRVGPYDGSVPLEQRNRPENWTAFASTGSPRFGQESTVVFPASGCWQIEAEIGANWLRAIVYIEPVSSSTTEEMWETLAWRPLYEMGLNDPPNCLRTPPELVGDSPIPLAGDATGRALPAYLGGLDESGALHLAADATTANGYYAAVTLWASDAYNGPLLVRTVEGRGTIAFAPFGDPSEYPSGLRLHSNSSYPERYQGWQQWPAYLQLPGPGCYALQIEGLDFTSQIVFEAVLDPPQPSEQVSWDGTFYAFSYGGPLGVGVVAIDGATGSVGRVLDVRPAGNSPYLVVSPDGTRLAVSAYLPGEEYSLDVLIYRTSDWSLEHRLTVPTLMQYIGEAEALAFSSDSSTLFVYQYEVPPGGSGNDARYWFEGFDLNAGVWLPEFGIPGCSGIEQVEPRPPQQLFVVCSRTAHEIDGATGERRSAVSYRQQVVSIAISGDRLFAVSPTREVYVQPLGTDASAAWELQGAVLTNPDDAVPYLRIGIDPSGRYLFLPTATVIETEGHAVSGSYYHQASEVVVFDVLEDRVVRAISTSKSFQDIAYSVDGSVALLSVVDERGWVVGLAALDLNTGTLAQLASGSFGRLVAP